MANEANENFSLSTFSNDDLDADLLLSKLEEMDLSENPLLTILDKAMSFPGAKINRATFLMETYHLSESDLNSKSFSDLLSLEQMDAAAKNTSQTM